MRSNAWLLWPPVSAFYDATWLIDKLEIRRTKAVPSAGVNWDSFLGFYDLEARTMNKDVFEGKWKQIRGEAKSWWGKLTDDDLDRAAGKFDVFIGLLQEKYGYTRERAADEIDKHVTDYEASLKNGTKPTTVK